MRRPERSLLAWVELVSVSALAILSITVAVLDASNLIDANSWLAQRKLHLVLLSVGFIAGYLIIERRSRLDALSAQISQTTSTIVRELGGRTDSFESGADWLTAVGTRMRSARKIDDVSWANAPAVEHLWSHADRDASKYCDDVAREVMTKREVIYRDLCVFYTAEQLAKHQHYARHPRATGYSLRHFPIPPSDAIPLIGGFMVVDEGSSSAEVFIASGDSKLWLRSRNPSVVKYYHSYFNNLWEKSTKLKDGSRVYDEAWKKAESELSGTTERAVTNESTRTA